MFKKEDEILSAKYSFTFLLITRFTVETPFTLGSYIYILYPIVALITIAIFGRKMLIKEKKLNYRMLFVHGFATSFLIPISTLLFSFDDFSILEIFIYIFTTFFIISVIYIINKIIILIKGKI